MTFLPIVERELRLAARKWSSFWLRVASALVTVLIGCAFLVFTLVGLVQPNAVGSTLFGLLSWLAFLVTIFAGVFFTSDAISEEKREGTLGLLFLTDLRSHDVVLGKLVSNSLRAAFGLLATFPILALALIMGGITGAEFWRAMLALLVTLAFSLTTGIAVSSMTTDGRRSLGGTLLVMITTCALLPLADAIWSAQGGGNFVPRLCHLSPGYMFARASAGGAPFWLTLGCLSFLCLVMIAIACWRTPHNWRDAATHVGGRIQEGWRYDLAYGSPGARARRRQSLLSVNPILWLCTRLRWRGTTVIALLILTLLAVVGLFLWPPLRELAVAARWMTEPPSGWAFDAETLQAGALATALIGAGALGWLMQFWMASESARFFLESRRNGALELILSTPLTGSEVIAGMGRALRHLFWLPVVLLISLHLIAGAIAIPFVLKEPGAAMTLTGVPFYNVAGVIGVLSRTADIITLGWVGLWMGLTSRSATTAVLKSLVFVQVLPGLVISFITPFLTFIPLLLFARQSAPGGPGGFEWFLLTIPSLGAELLWLAKDFVFYRWARSRLQTDLRVLALPDSARVWMPPVLPPAEPAVQTP